MVYVDDMKASYRGMVMCHMVADTTEELLDMADRIGVKRRWLQHKGKYKEHFDICLSKKRKAIELGAKPITQRELGSLLHAKRASS